MIKLVQQGIYQLIESNGQMKILSLDKTKTYAWIWAAEIGELLIASHNSHKVDHILVNGKYRIYDVDDEPQLVDLPHLELSVGNRKWQSYLLPTGMPRDNKTRKRIIPANETITGKFEFI